MQTAYDDAGSSIKQVEKRLADMALLIKNIENYKKTLSIQQAYRQAKNPEKFYDEKKRPPQGTHSSGEAA